MRRARRGCGEIGCGEYPPSVRQLRFDFNPLQTGAAGLEMKAFSEGRLLVASLPDNSSLTQIEAGHLEPGGQWAFGGTFGGNPAMRAMADFHGWFFSGVRAMSQAR